MNEWLKLLASLREKCGYTGSAKIADVKTFIDANGIEPILPSGKSLDEVYKSFKTVTVVADAGEEVVVQEMPAEGEAMADGDEPKPEPEKTARNGRAKTVGATMLSAQGFTNVAARKAYDRRVASKHLDPDNAPAFSDGDQAQAFGSWYKSMMAAIHPGRLGHIVSNYDRDVIKSYFGSKASSSATLTGGGALVPDEFLPDIIQLFERYGVVRTLFQRVPMNREFMTIPKRLNEVEIYQPGQNNPITQDDVEYGQVEITARTWLGLSLHPLSLIEDSAINMADVVANAFASAHAKQEDRCGLLGDGTSSFLGIRGIAGDLLSKDATPGNVAGIVNAGANWPNITFADFNTVVGRTPEYAGEGSGEAWVVSKPFYRTVMEPILLAAGGSTGQERVDGKYVANFLGHPVYISQVMPRVTANNTICALFGNFAQGAFFGDRGQFEILTSDDRYFENDQLAIKSRSRVGITVHSLGNASGTAALRVAGPIVALRTTA